MIDLSEKKLMICEGCHMLGGRDVVMVSKKRCVLCGRLNKPLVLDLDGKRHPKKQGKHFKDAKRFPRELATDPMQKKIVDLITSRAHDFDCPGKIVDIRKGPMVTEYEFVPDRFTRLKKIKDINEDLAIALAVDSVTVQRLAGKAAVGICIPNEERKPVLFADCLKNVVAHRDDMELPINFGITSTGEPYVEDLVTMPHLLVAGSTNSGKSVFLNNVLTSLLYIRSPKQLQLVLVDPKTVELFPYKGLPHLRHDPVAGVYEALGLMEEVIQEMRRRTSNLHILKSKNIKEYNDRMKAEGHPEECWPYILFVIDEMADLVLQEKKSFTEKMATIAQMARAAGIHVIAATQRPSVDVLSGKIKVNFPARCAFRVPAAPDSKTILARKGAEQLLGKGDMFYISPTAAGMSRLHAPLVIRADVEQMLKLSIEFGHVNSVPADVPITPTVVPTPVVQGNGKPVRVN